MNTHADFQSKLADLKLAIHGAIVVLTCRCGFLYIKFKERLADVEYVGHDEVVSDVYYDRLNCAEDTLLGENEGFSESIEKQLEDMTAEQLMWVLEQLEGGLYAEMSMTDFFDQN